MPNDNYISELDGAQIEAALEAIDSVVTPGNNGKLLAVENGAIVAKSASEYTDVPVLAPLSVTANGNYTPPSGVDGFDEVHVAVPGAALTTKSITANGTYNASQDNADGYSSVTVAVPGGATIEPLSVTQNGTYTPPSGVDGFAPVTVNVSGRGDDPFELKNYIESSGTQYIDTGYTVKDNSLFEAVALVSNPNIQWGTLFGTRVALDNNVCMYGAYGNNRPGVVICWGGSQAETTASGITAITGTKAVYSMFKQNFGLRNQEYTIGGEPAGGRTISNTYSIYLFALNTAGASEALTIAKLYRFRIYEGNTLVHEFIPWQENGVTCLKDTVTSEIKYNAGTGDFVYGTDA